MAYGFVDVNMKGVSEDDWDRLIEDHDYGVFANFEGETFEIVAKWNGRIKDKAVAPKEFWTPFEVIYYNIVRPVESSEFMTGSTETVKRTKDPSLSGFYSNPYEMMTAYRSRVRAAHEGDIDDREIYESEYDVVKGFDRSVPKAAIPVDEDLLEELVDEVGGDKPDESTYGDGGW